MISHPFPKFLSCVIAAGLSAAVPAQSTHLPGNQAQGVQPGECTQKKLPCSVQAQWGSGPVSPKYQYHYTLDISPVGAGTLRYRWPGFKASPEQSWTFQLTRSQLTALMRRLHGEGLAELTPPPGPPPLGGPEQRAEIHEGEQTYSVPSFVDASHRKQQQAVLRTIKDVVPHTITHNLPHYE